MSPHSVRILARPTRAPFARCNMQWSLLAAATLLRATHASEPEMQFFTPFRRRGLRRRPRDAAQGRDRLRRTAPASSAAQRRRASSGGLLRSTPLVALGRPQKRWWQRGLLRKKDSPFAAYSTRADEAVDDDGVEQPRRPREKRVALCASPKECYKSWRTAPSSSRSPRGVGRDAGDGTARARFFPCVKSGLVTK